MTVGDVIICSRGVKFFRFNSGKALYAHTGALKVAWEMGIYSEEVATMSFTCESEGIVCEISTVYKDNGQA